MGAKILYLFPDTNLFVQCQPLEQLDWTVWKEFAEVHLLVSRPVQLEIDRQKNRGSDRLGRRARDASSLFRQVILGADDAKVIWKSDPCVKLFIVPEHRPSEELRDRLDYQERDDQLVGTAYSFMRKNPGVEVMILTHDTGPMASAKMVDVATAPIPDHWLLPPESSDSERKILALENEVTRLKKAEPAFRVAFLNQEGKQVAELETESTCYEALADSEVSELMTLIREAVPAATDFGPREPAERKPQVAGILIPELTTRYRPASAKEIARYQDQRYPGWLERCQEILQNYHQALQRRTKRPVFLFVASNDGIRPAKHALITIAAKGRFKIKSPPHQDDDNKRKKEGVLEFPPSPVPPRGEWKSSLEDLTGMGNLRQQLDLAARYNSPFMTEALRLPILSPRDTQPDPNGFYYKPTRPAYPVAEFSLECQQWRHGIGEENFGGEIYFKASEGEIVGSLECRIHAENLSNPVELVIPARIRIRRLRAYDLAKEAVGRLIARGGD